MQHVENSNCIMPFSRKSYYALNFLCNEKIIDPILIKRNRNTFPNERKRRTFPVSHYFFYYLASPQGQGHHNSVSQLLWSRIT